MNGITLGPLLVLFVVSVALPILVGLATKLHASAATKSTLLAVLAIINGLVTNAASDNGSAFISKEALVMAAFSAVMAWSSYAGFTKHQPAVTALKVKTANFGIGGSSD